MGPSKLAKVFFHAVEAKKSFFIYFSGKLDFSFYLGSKRSENTNSKQEIFHAHAHRYHSFVRT